MVRRQLVVALLALLALALLASPAPAQEPGSSPGGDQCLPGQLCIPNEGNVETGPSRRQPVNDPPGAWVRSVIALGAILVVMVVYFVVALGGGRLPGWVRRRSARA
jgi:hypothetical protein